MRISDWSSDVCSSDLTFIPPNPAVKISPSAPSNHRGLTVISANAFTDNPLISSNQYSWVSGMIVAYSDCSPTTMSPAVCIQVSLNPTHSKPTQSITQRHVPLRSDEHKPELPSQIHRSSTVIC